MESLTARRKRWLIALGLLRALATTVVMVSLYYVLPFERRPEGSVVVELTVGVAVMVAVMTWQLWAIVHASYPGIRAVQSLASTTPLFLLLFASSYFVLSLDDPAMFSEPLSRSDSLYFTITVFTTVGFGDIVAQAATARLIVAVQMLLDLLVVGLGVKVILGAVKKGQAARHSPDT